MRAERRPQRRDDSDRLPDAGGAWLHFSRKLLA